MKVGILYEYIWAVYILKKKETKLCNPQFSGK